MTELETAQKRIAELEARVQELGQMARDVNSRRVVELESELAAMRAGGGLTKWRIQQHPTELPDGEVVDYPLLPGDFKDGWTEQPLYTHPQPAAQDAERLDCLEKRGIVSVKRCRYFGEGDDKGVFEITTANYDSYEGVTLREAIDAAIAAQGEKE